MQSHTQLARAKPSVSLVRVRRRVQAPRLEDVSALPSDAAFQLIQEGLKRFGVPAGLHLSHKTASESQERSTCSATVPLMRWAPDPRAPLQTDEIASAEVCEAGTSQKVCLHHACGRLGRCRTCAPPLLAPPLGTLAPEALQRRFRRAGGEEPTSRQVITPTTSP